MAKVKVAIWGTVGKVVEIDPSLGPRVAALESAVNSLTGVAASSTTRRHSSLSGLQADDHPQYTMWEAAERIIGQWQWVTSLWGPNGTAAAPSFTFTTDADTGIYRVGVDNIGVSTGGVYKWDVDTTRVRQVLPLYIDIPTPLVGTEYLFQQALPGTNDGGFQYVMVDETAVHNDITHMLGFWTSGTTATWPPSASGVRGWRTEYRSQTGIGAGALFRLRGFHNSSTGTVYIQAAADTNQVLLPIGLVGSPGMGFLNNAANGFYSTGTNNASLAVGGTQVWGASSSVFTAVQPFQLPDGAVNALALRFSSDTDNGFYYITTNSFGLATAGALRFQFGAAGQLGIGGATYGTSGHAFKSGGSGGAPTWGVLAEVGGGTNQSTYTTGDLLYASASNTLAKRAIGATEDLLTVVAGVPTWRTRRRPLYGAGTVAALPAGTVGDEAYVTDALAPAYGAAVVGGGAVVIPVFRDATQWIVG